MTQIVARLGCWNITAPAMIAGPVGPVAPLGPVDPLEPVGPVTVLVAPVAPVGPPAGPVAPVGPVAFMLVCSCVISLAAVSNAATMLPKLVLNPTLSLLIPGTGKLTLMPDTLTFILDAMVRHCDCAVFIVHELLAHWVVTTNLLSYDSQQPTQQCDAVRWSRTLVKYGAIKIKNSKLLIK